MTSSNLELIHRAESVLPGGVNSPVRAFRAVGGTPPFIESASGSKLIDAEGNEFIDYVGSWGPMILGHAFPPVLDALKDQLTKGLSYGAPTALEVEFAEAICQRIPSIEMLRCVSSGTEATMSALRVARGFTGRDLIIKFEGGYHGHSDALLVNAGSGLATFGEPNSAGVPAAAVQHTATLKYNDIEGLKAFFAEHGKEVAAVIVEPVSGNMGCVAPVDGFLESIIELCQEAGAVSIFDEVMTGLRLSASGAQGRYGLSPDLSCFGKVIGGGLPLAIYGGRADIMSRVSPLGPVYQAGTLSGNPLAVRAGLAMMSHLDSKAYELLEARSQFLGDGLEALSKDCRLKVQVQRVGSMVTVFFSDVAVNSWDEAKSCNTEAFAKFHATLRSKGIYWPPSQFEAAFISTAHSEQDLQQTLDAAKAAFAAV